MKERDISTQLFIFPHSSFRTYFSNNGRGGRGEGRYIFKGKHSVSRMTLSSRANKKRDGDEKRKEERKEGRKKKLHPWPSTDFNFAKKERPALFQPFPLTTSPANAGRGGGGEASEKSRSIFSIPSPFSRLESLSVSLVLPLFIARGCSRLPLHNTDKSRSVSVYAICSRCVP